MKYQMDLGEFSFNKIKSGRRVDMRLFDKKRQSLKIGDTIEYVNTNNPAERIECLTPQMMGYDNKNEVLVRLNRAYSKEMQKNFNVVAIFIKDVTPPIIEILRGENER